MKGRGDKRDPYVVIAPFDLLDELLHGRIMERGGGSIEVLGNEIDTPLVIGTENSEDLLGPNERMRAFRGNQKAVAVLLAKGLANAR
jgi:hypothetical protein